MSSLSGSICVLSTSTLHNDVFGVRLDDDTGHGTLTDLFGGSIPICSIASSVDGNRS